MEFPKTPKSTENIDGNADSNSPRKRSLRSPRRERRGGAISKHTQREQYCDTCMDTSMAGICNQIGTTAFYLANKLQGKHATGHGEKVEVVSGSQNDDSEHNLSQAPSKMQSTLFAPLEDEFQSSGFICENRADLEPTIQERQSHMINKKSHRLKLADVQEKLAKFSLYGSASCGHENLFSGVMSVNITSAFANSTTFANQSQIRSGQVYLADSESLNATILCPVCGRLSSYEDCPYCSVQNKDEETSVNKSKLPLSTLNAQQLGNEITQPKCRETMDTDKSSNDENVKEEHDVHETSSENEKLDHFDMNIPPNTRKRKTRNRHAECIKENTCEKSHESMSHSQRYGRIGKRLTRKDGQTYLQKSRDLIKKDLCVKCKPDPIEIIPQESTESCRKSVLNKFVSCPANYPLLKRAPNSKGLPNLSQEPPPDSQFHETECVNKNNEGGHSIRVSSTNTNEEGSNSLCNFVGSSASLDVDVVYERSAKKGPKETPADKQSLMAINQCLSDDEGTIPFVDESSAWSIEAKFINPLAIDSIDSLYRGSTLSLDLSEETVFAEHSVAEPGSIFSLWASNDWKQSLNCSTPSLGNLEEHHRDNMSDISMCYLIGTGSNVGSIACNGAPESTPCRSASYDLSDGSYYNEDKAIYLQGRLRKFSTCEYSSVFIPEGTEGNIFCRYGHRGRRRKSYRRGYEINKPKSDVMGASPERIKKNLDKKSTAPNYRYIRVPYWPKLEAMASELLDICSDHVHYKRDQSKSSKSGNDVRGDATLEKKRIQAAKACIKKLHESLVSGSDSTTSESSD